METLFSTPTGVCIITTHNSIRDGDGRAGGGQVSQARGGYAREWWVSQWWEDRYPSWDRYTHPHLQYWHLVAATETLTLASGQ